MKSAYLFLVIWLALLLGFITLNTPKAQSLKMGPVLMVPAPPPHPFNATVGRWSRELKNMPSPPGADGNCLPVAVELQKRIVRTGRMAWIVGIDPDPTDDSGHAVVVYDSDLDERVDSFADNGFVTHGKPRMLGPLLRGAYGEFQGRCIEPEGSTCKRLTGTLF